MGFFYCEVPLQEVTIFRQCLKLGSGNQSTCETVNRKKTIVHVSDYHKLGKCWF